MPGPGFEGCELRTVPTTRGYQHVMNGRLASFYSHTYDPLTSLTSSCACVLIVVYYYYTINSIEAILHHEGAQQRTPAMFLRMHSPNGMSSQNKRVSTFGAKRPGET